MHQSLNRVRIQNPMIRKQTPQIAPRKNLQVKRAAIITHILVAALQKKPLIIHTIKSQTPQPRRNTTCRLKNRLNSHYSPNNLYQAHLEAASLRPKSTTKYRPAPAPADNFSILGDCCPSPDPALGSLSSHPNFMAFLRNSSGRINPVSAA